VIKILTDKDVGRWVYYVPNHAKKDKSQWERGRIKSFNNTNKIAFVVYKANDNWEGDHWKDYTAPATNYEDLEFSHEN
jgi:hypothetical protein